MNSQIWEGRQFQSESLHRVALRLAPAFYIEINSTTMYLNSNLTLVGQAYCYCKQRGCSHGVSETF